MEGSKRRRMVEASAAAPELPDEMMTEVFLRLPVKSILRFRAVCRSWATALSSDQFFGLHAAKMAEAEWVSPKLFSMSPTPSFDAVGLYSCSPPTSSSSGSGPVGDGGLLFTLDDVRGDFADMTPAPCRGLSLLHDAVAPAYYVFNAATRAVTRLPSYQDSCFATAGLGFDARTKEYKVVRLFQGDHKQNRKIKCEVYVLGGGDRWRQPSPSPRGVVTFRVGMAAIRAATQIGVNKLQPVFADGCLHWLLNPAELSATERAAAAAVLSFSVTDETFTSVRSPPFQIEVRGGVHLVEIDDHLCMARPHGGTVMEIWKMKAAGDYWSLEHSIDLSQHVGRGLIEPHVNIRVVGSVGNCTSRKKVILVTSKRKVIAYDPLSKTTHETSLAIHLETHSSYDTEQSIPRVSLFRERLAPVKKTKDEMFSSSPMGMATKEILLRLPGQYVMQCKLVSKQWHGLIQSQSFMRSYCLRNNMDRRPKVMIVAGKGKDAAGGLGFRFAPLQELLLQRAPSHDDAGTSWLETKVICSKPCHGMNLISNHKEDYLCNPCTGYRCIFPSRFRASHAISNAASTPNNGHAFAVGNKIPGLGFDLLRQEHVIVEILYHLKDFASRRYSLTFSVIGCNGGAAQDHFEPPLPLNDMPPAYLAGVLYWMSEPRLGHSSERAVVQFDIATRTFDVSIPCPACWNNTSPCDQAFVVELEGILCVVFADPVAEELHVWKLLEKNGQCWDRAYKLHLNGWSGYSLRENVVVPLGVDPKNGRIFLNTGRKLGLYDLVNRSIENLYALDEVYSGYNGVQSLERKNNMILPLVPMLHEESLTSYPLLPKGRWLW